MKRGLRESQWHVLRRCLAIVRRAERGPCSWQDLAEAVLAEEGAEAYGLAEGEALRRRVEKDLARIRERLQVEVRYDQAAGGYTIEDSGTPLLDLPDGDLAAMAWLAETFGPNSPQHREVSGLLSRLRLYLAPERRAELERRHTALVLDLGRRDEDTLAPRVWDLLTRALVERRRIEISYLSPEHADRAPRRHVVDPWERYFDAGRGHYYLHGWCHYTLGPRGRREHGRYFDYRVGRISEVVLLPQKLPPSPPPAPCYTVEYELSPRIARLGISRQRGIEIREVERREDGSALVRGETDSPFWAVQALLAYGGECRVLGGPEVLARMRAVVGRMGELYGGEG
ncbi:MAG: WYL domain-containing protein [Anaerolineae bacterium]|nr:WYL domain-containing protein [Anaerolineae bacterium]